MAYRRRRMSRRRPRRRVGSKKVRTRRNLLGLRRRVSGGSRLARQVASLSRRVSSEVKFLDTLISATVPTTTTGYSAVLNAIKEGDDYNNRQGHKVTAKNVTINWTCTKDATAVDTVVRLVIAIGKVATPGTAWTYANIYGAGSDYTSQIASYAGAGVNFVILKDKMIHTNSVYRNRTGKITIGLSDIATEWVSGTDTDIIKNQIFLCAVSNDNVNKPVLGFYARYRYYDN